MAKRVCWKCGRALPGWHVVMENKRTCGPCFQALLAQVKKAKAK